HAEPPLDPLHLPCHRALRQPHDLGGFGEAAVLRHQVEEVELVDVERRRLQVLMHRVHAWMPRMHLTCKPSNGMLQRWLIPLTALPRMCRVASTSTRAASTATCAAPSHRPSFGGTTRADSPMCITSRRRPMRSRSPRRRSTRARSTRLGTTRSRDPRDSPWANVVTDRTPGAVVLLLDGEGLHACREAGERGLILEDHELALEFAAARHRYAGLVEV